MRNPSWKILSIGCLEMNLFWGEMAPVRESSCTSMLIEAGSRRIIVDPGLDSTDRFQTVLDRRSGYKPEDIDTVFLTHFHKNHRRSLWLFKSSVWLMSRAEIRWWMKREDAADEDKDFLARIVPFEEHTLPGLQMLATPGHTHGSASLMFETREGMVVAAGDAILTFDHFDAREPAAEAEDPKEARRSIDRIAKIADVVVPGHDNYFVI
ncbi:MAG: MBL fold metallo-hydrolase [Candidatus Omnitrophota bacterium]